MSAYRWLINTIDRVAMVEEVINEFSASEISINSMEVFPCKIYVKFNTECERDVKLLLSKLLLNPDVISVTRSKLQPYERKEKLQAILESTTDGIIGINNQGNINYFNKVAEDFFSISRENIVGVNISKILSGKTSRCSPNCSAATVSITIRWSPVRRKGSCTISAPAVRF